MAAQEKTFAEQMTEVYKALGPDYEADPGEDLATTFAKAEQAQAEVFYSTSRGLRLIRQGQNTGTNAVGQTLDLTPPGGRVIYDFSPNGSLTVHEGQDVLPDGSRGEEQDAITWLTNHPRFNRRFFWQGHEPGMPQPTERVYMELVRAGVIGRDIDGLLELRKREEDTHGRPMLLAAVDNAIMALQSVAEPEPEPDELPPDFDRADALRYLRECEVAVPAEATDSQIYDLVVLTAESQKG
jgi:hypothetical protein